MDGIIACPGCQRKLRLREDCAGKLVQCPACLIQFSVPLSDLRALPDPSVPGGALPRESVTPEEERGGPPERLVWQQPRRRLSWPGEEPEDSSLESRGGKGGRLVLGLVIAGLVITLTLGGWVAV